MCCFHQDFFLAVIALFTVQKLYRQPHLCTSPSLAPFFQSFYIPISWHTTTQRHMEPKAVNSLLSKGWGRRREGEKGIWGGDLGAGSMRLEGQAVWREPSTGEERIRWAGMTEAERSKDFATDCPVMKLKYGALNCKVGEAEWDKRKPRD